jgi:hypothetical protein
MTFPHVQFCSAAEQLSTPIDQKVICLFQFHPIPPDVLYLPNYVPYSKPKLKSDDFTVLESLTAEREQVQQLIKLIL